MRKNRTFAILTILLVCIVIAASACIDSGGGGEDPNLIGGYPNVTPNPTLLYVTQSANATATSGSIEFRIQLTAIADEKNQP